ncbi:MAG: App1 family protein [Opitutales bacterium]
MKGKRLAHSLEKVIDRTRIRVKSRLGWTKPIIAFPYRGYGTPHAVKMRGRVLEKEARIHSGDGVPSANMWQNFKKMLDRFESDEIPRATVSAELLGRQTQAVSDEEGYFELNFTFTEPLRVEPGWYPVALTLESVPYGLKREPEAAGEVYIAPPEVPEFGVISDVDDTILQSNITSTFGKFWTALRYDAAQRTPFEGVEALYRMLVGKLPRPLFFVSGSSYNLYDLLVDFTQHHRIPKAPFLLRDLGLTTLNWIKQDSRPYKLGYIRELFEMYPGLNFILIGDSGERDPEIYRDICRDFPGRVKAIYIRHVAGHERRQEVEALREQLNVDLLLMDTTDEAIEHAREHGWIA